MAATAAAQPLALPATGGAPPPSVRIEPAVLLSIADAHGRRPADGGADRVIGTLLGGFAPDGAVDVRDCFTVPHSETAEQVHWWWSVDGERDGSGKLLRSMFSSSSMAAATSSVLLPLLLLPHRRLPSRCTFPLQNFRSPSTSPTTPTFSPSTAGSRPGTPSSAGSQLPRRAPPLPAATRSSTISIPENVAPRTFRFMLRSTQP